jgi:hypothetical protein
MIYTRPFITRHFIAYEGESRSAELSLAVQVVDAFTQAAPDVPLDVRLKELRFMPPTRSIGGFFCFQGREIGAVDGGTLPTRTLIPDGNYTLVVEPNPLYGSRYFLEGNSGDPGTTFERPVVIGPYVTPVVLPLNPVRAPLEVVRLIPTPAYPFPSTATLVRGKVLQGGNEVAAAVVRTDYKEIHPTDSTQTVFVHVETYTDRGGEFVLFFKRLRDKSQPINIQVVKNGPPFPVNTQITEGTPNNLGNINLP